MCACDCHRTASPRPRFRPLSLAFQILATWLLLVLAGGTLMRTQHPVASEAGRLIQTVTFVEPAIEWMDARGYGRVAGGLRLVAAGIPVG